MFIFVPLFSLTHLKHYHNNAEANSLKLSTHQDREEQSRISSDQFGHFSAV